MNRERDLMTVRITLSCRPGERSSLGSALRSRFGFSLIQAPLFHRTIPWTEELDVPEQRTEIRSEPMKATPARLLEEELELSLLLRGHPVAPRA
jgi:hypothetical protein